MKSDQHPTLKKNLIENCQKHLETEKELLEEFIQHTMNIHNALGESVFPGDAEIREGEKELAEKAEQVSRDRKIIRKAIAVQLGVPEADATIRRLAETLDAKPAAALMVTRDQILDLHGQIAAISESNALLLQQSIDIYQKILQSLAGQPNASPTYSSTGKVASQPTVSLVSTQG